MPAAHPRRRRPLQAIAAISAAVAVAAAPAAAAPKTKPGSVTATAGAVTAKVSYVRSGHGYLRRYRHLRLTLTGHGTPITAARLVKNATTYGTPPALTLADLNADGVPDLIVDTYSGGAHCCTTSSIVLSTPQGWGTPIVKGWGDYPYALKDLGGTAAPELVSADDRFAYAFTAYAGSIPAIRIYSLAGGTVQDVTGQFPGAVREEVARVSGYWDEAAKTADGDPEGVQAVTAAWVADLVSIGDLVGAKAVIDKTAAAGFMTGGPSGNWANAKTFAGQLAYDLVHWGYLADPTQIGLPATT